nr:hypothetical protein [Tanacetum cinerariifolium]
MFIQPHDPDFVPEPIYPEYIPLEDEHILPAEEQPLPPVVSPTTESPGYVAESNLEEDPKEYEEDEAEDGPVDYPMDGGDDGDDEDDGDSLGYDIDDEDEDNGDEEEEEEHLAPADSAVFIPIDELISISLPPEAEVERLLAMPTPSPSPFTSLSPPSAGERLARCTALAALPKPPLPPFSYPPPPVDRRDGILESEQPPRKRLCLSTLGFRYEEGESSTKGRGDLYALLEDAQDGLRETDRLRQSQMVETLRVMRDMRREMGDMQAELLALRGQPKRAGKRCWVSVVGVVGCAGSGVVSGNGGKKEVWKLAGNTVQCTVFQTVGVREMECWTGMHEMAMAAFESQYIDKDTYSASAKDIKVQSCFLDDHLTNLSPSRNCMPPDVLLRESRQPV